VLLAVVYSAVALASNTLAPHWAATLASGSIKQAAANTQTHGVFRATLKAKTLTWRLTLTKLSGPATLAAIRSAQQGRVVLRLCQPCTTGASGSATLGPVALSEFSARDLLYVTVSTRAHPSGEVRGQLRQA
jgi:hypothetical protein